MLILKTLEDVTIDGVFIEKGRQLNIQHATPEMLKAKVEGKLELKDAMPTLEERRSDIAAFNLS